MIVTIWSNGCIICEQAKAFFRKMRRYSRIRIVELDEMIGGRTDEDTDVLSEIAMEQGGAFPLVKVNGVRIETKDLIAVIGAWDDAGKPVDFPHEWRMAACA